MLHRYLGTILTEYLGPGGSDSDELPVRVDGADIVDYIARGIDILSEVDVDVSSNIGGSEYPWSSMHLAHNLS